MRNNNFGKANVPSNVYMNHSGNPFANFNPMTTNQMGRPNMNFNQAYRQNTPMIDPINYQNQNNLIHNNVAEHVLDEHVVEYRLNIDSADRDPGAYKDPFSYTVTFNPSSTTPGPTINREFRNVKYVKLESIVLPRYTYIEEVDEAYEINTDTSSHLYDDRFVVLNIEQLEGIESRVYGTNKDLTNSFAQIVPDKLISSTYYTGLPYLGTRYFKDNKLENMTKLKIQFKDSYGNDLKIQEVENDGGNINVIDSDPLATKQEDGSYMIGEEEIALTDVRHPLNRSFQNHMSLVIGVVESGINTNTQFAR